MYAILECWIARLFGRFWLVAAAGGHTVHGRSHPGDSASRGLRKQDGGEHRSAKAPHRARAHRWGALSFFAGLEITAVVRRHWLMGCGLFWRVGNTISVFRDWHLVQLVQLSCNLVAPQSTITTIKRSRQTTTDKCQAFLRRVGAEQSCH